MSEWKPGDRCRVVEQTPDGHPDPSGRVLTGTVTSAVGEFVHVATESGTMAGTLSLTFHAESGWLAGPAEGEFRWRLLPGTGEDATAAAGEDRGDG